MTESAVIFSSVRTGSTWLGETLYQHPDITYVEELMLGKLHLSEDQRLEIVQESLRACGTPWHLWKLQSYQSWLGLLEGIESDTGIAVIFLRRENLLDWHVSLLVSQQLKIYTRRLGDVIPEVSPFEIDPQGLQHEMDKELAWWAQIREWFTDREMYIETTYDRLREDYDGEADRLFRFLGLSPVRVQTTMLKMQERDSRNMVTNFTELQELFGATYGEYGFA